MESDDGEIGNNIISSLDCMCSSSPQIPANPGNNSSLEEEAQHIMGRRKRRRRQRMSKSRLQKISESSLSLLSFLSLFSTGYSLQQKQQQSLECIHAFRDADHDGDGFLTRYEYAEAIGLLSNDDSEPHFPKLPLHLQEAFDSLSEASCGPIDCIHITSSMTEQQLDQTICKYFDLASTRSSRSYKEDNESTQQQEQTMHMLRTSSSQQGLYDEIIPPSPTILMMPQPSHQPLSSSGLPPSIIPSQTRQQQQEHRVLQTLQQCKIALSVGDQNRDDELDEAQYVRFVNQFSRLSFDGSVFAEPLPPYLQASFNKFANGGTVINVEGSKPNADPTPDQATFVEDLCNETIELLQNPPPPSEPTTLPPVEPTTPAPAPPGGGTPTPGGDETINCENTIARTQCSTALTIADSPGRDDQLDKAEFVKFVNRLNLNAFTGDTFDDLPPNVQAIFTKFSNPDNGLIDISGSKPGQTPDADQDIFLGDLCCEADLAADNPGAPFATLAPAAAPPTTNETMPSEPPSEDVECVETIPRVQCNAFLSFADVSRDDLVDETEYVRFVNRLSRNAYLTTAFDDLPGNFIDNFEKFATTGGQIDVAGSKPGQTPTPEQDDFLDTLCCETGNVVQNPGTRMPVMIGGPTPAPEPSPPVGSPPPTFHPTLCRTALASSDFSRDNYLSMDEYVRFLNRLTGNEFVGMGFEDLDAPLQSNYENLADETGEINILGSKPGQTPTDEQDDHLSEICWGTASALVSEPTTLPPDVPTASPQPTGPTDPQPSLPPTFQNALCRSVIGASDFNRDDYLNEDEFIRVLNRLTRNQFLGKNFTSLDIPLPQVFDRLTTNETGQIWIFGTKAGQEASDEQTEFIYEICLQISLALDRLGETFPPTPSPEEEGVFPTPAPEPSAPTLPPGVSEVFNSFILSNTAAGGGLDAGQVWMESEQDRNGLNAAYGVFAQLATNELIEREEEAEEVVIRRHLRSSRRNRRRLEVSFLNDTEEVYQVVESECPGSMMTSDDTSNSCLTAFASFRVSIDDNEDPDEVSTFYTFETQTLIEDGVLQQILNETFPGSQFVVVNASFPVQVTSPPSLAPVATPMPSFADSPTNSSMPSSQPSTAAPTITPIPTLQPTNATPSLPPTTSNSTNNSTEPPVTEPPVEGPSGEGVEADGGGGGSSIGIIIGGAVGVVALLGGAGFAYKKFSDGGLGRVGNKRFPGSDKGSDRDGGSDTGRDGPEGGFGLDNIFSGASPEQSKGKKNADTPAFGGGSNDDDDDDDSDDDDDDDDDDKKEEDESPTKADAKSSAAADAFGGIVSAFTGFGKSESTDDPNKTDAFGGDGTSGFGGLETQDTNDTFGGFGGFGADTFGGGAAATDTSKTTDSNDGGGFFGGLANNAKGWFDKAAFEEEELPPKTAAKKNNAKDDDDQSGSQSYVEESYHSSQDGSGSGSGSGSYRSGEDSRSHYSDEEGSQSYYSGEDESQTYRSGDEEGSYRSGEDSRGSQSFYSGDEGSQGSQSFHSSQDGSRTEQSYHSSQDGSRTEQSYHSSQDGSRTEQSYHSSEEGSQSYVSGEEGSQGSRSYYSGDEGSQGSRSYYSDEEGSQGSRSYYSGEEGSQGSRSYYSDEEESIEPP